jgi:hypothetical protein
MSPVVDVIKWIADKIQWVINKAKAVGDFFGGLFSAPAAPAPAGAGGGTRGLFGAPGGLRTAGLLTAGGGIGSSPSGAAPGLGETTVNITVNGALDPVAVGRQIQTVLRDYSRRTGQTGRRGPMTSPTDDPPSLSPAGHLEDEPSERPPVLDDDAPDPASLAGLRTVAARMDPTPFVNLAGVDLATGPGSVGGPMVLDDLAVTWGRNEVLDQPTPATATLPCSTRPGCGRSAGN